MTSQGSTRQRWAALALGLGLAPLAAEALFRIVHPPSRVQTIHSIRMLDGVPVWAASHDDRTGLPCAPGKPVVAFVGSSILYGSGTDAEHVFTARLRAERPDLCIVNLAQPGYGYGQKLAVARESLTGLHPVQVYWEVWANDLSTFTVVGDRAYNLGGLDIEPGWLFTHSEAWAHLVVSRARPIPQGNDPWSRLDLSGVLPFSPVLVFAPPLERPFAATAADPPDFERVLRPWGEAHGLRTLSLAEALIDQDHLALRADPCCHYNAAGHERLAEIFGAMLPPAAGPDEAAP